MTDDDYADALISRAEWIDTLLISGVVLCVVVTLTRRLRKEKFEILGIDVPLKVFPAACIAYTFAHVYLTIIFCGVVNAIPSGSRAVWAALTMKGPLTFAGMQPREPISWSGGIFTRISSSDPTTWLFCAFCFVLFIAFRSAAEVAGMKKRTKWILVSLLILINWVCGSIWSEAASRLALTGAD